MKPGQNKNRCVITILLFCPLILAVCGIQKKAVLRPEPVPVAIEEQAETVESTEIIQTQDGPGSKNLPDWLGRYINGGIPEVESSNTYRDRYIFIGKTRGSNLNALQQWADGFSVFQDFPRLAAARIESRLIADASLYPDDEYGEYFEALIKQASDAEYPGAVKESAYWIKTKAIVRRENADADPDEINEPLIVERYEFFVLLSIDKATLQNRVRELMASIKTGVAPTRAQEAAINRVQQSFFGGF